MLKNHKNAQSTAKKDILRKTNRQTTQNSANNTKSNDQRRNVEQAKRNKQHSPTEKNIKTDINNEEKLAQKKTSAETENKTTIEKPHKCRKTTQKAPINTEMLKNANRRQKQPDKAQKPPHTTNTKPATARQR